MQKVDEEVRTSAGVVSWNTSVLEKGTQADRASEPPSHSDGGELPSVERVGRLEILTLELWPAGAAVAKDQIRTAIANSV